MQYRRLVVLLMLAALAGIVMLAPPLARAQGADQGTIEGAVWRETVRRNFLQDPGEPGLSGLSVELWNTTSITGQPTRIQAVVTDSQGRYRFIVNALSGPVPDFGCYEVRLVVLTGAGGSQAVIRSQPICQVRAGDRVGLDFPIPGGATPPPVSNPPPATNQGVIQGAVFRDNNGNRALDAGDAVVPGAVVELWNTTSIAGQPVRAQSKQTNAQGRYAFVVNAFTGPLPDFGCYEVRVTLPASLGGGVARSQSICQVAPGAVVSANFALPGSRSANHAPSVLFVRVEPSGTQPGGTVRLQALGLDVDDERLTYQWTLSAGTFTNPEGPLIDWTAPNQPGNYPVRVVATDPGGLPVAAQVVIPVTATTTKVNNPPFVEQVTATTLTPAPRQVVRLTVKASDPDNDPLSNRFYFLGGARGARVGPNEVLWQAPSQPGIYSTYAVVNDNRGGLGWGKRELSVNSAQTLNRNHPSYGRAGQVLIESAGYLMWVGIDDPAVAQQATALAASGAQRWVVGRIVPDAGQRHGFYLDPSTVTLAEITAEGIQTNVEQVSRRPAHFAPGGGGGFAVWALAAQLIQFVPAQ